ncbi:hypothetical protein G9C98_000678 [Cotesia typhae]|uniref:omega-amidase n=1 Tax=Cotesia typhae TaxID=2053667 RepID=A0A8J5R8S2_9HYME|nr:hypothetical protein G9C98_000678 [Cotesia typhae]
MSTLRLALAQLLINSNKQTNIEKAVSFIELAKKQFADVVILPECFNSPYGPPCVSPARDTTASYVAWGHSQLTNPWGEVVHDLNVHENMIITEINSSIVEEVRSQIPTINQRRTDVYDTIYKRDSK